jgi:hypothetical protein
MKRLLIICVITLSCTLSAFSQIFHTANTLGPGKFMLGIEPVVFAQGNSNLGLFFHGGIGIKSGIDLRMKYGFINDHTDYFGGDLDWRLYNGIPCISLTTGIQSFGNNVGLNGALNLSFPIKSDIHLYTGLHTNLYFTHSNNQFWFPVGIDIDLRSNVALILEAEIPVNDSDYDYGVIGGGFSFKF